MEIRRKSLRDFLKPILVSVTLVGLILAFPLLSYGQTREASPKLYQETFKTRFLIAINKAELSLEQLQILQDLVKDTVAVRDELKQEYEDLNEFLINWSGESEAFDEALESEMMGINEAREALEVQLKEGMETIKETLSAAQFEIFKQTLMKQPFPRFDGQRALILLKPEQRPISRAQRPEMIERFKEHLSQLQRHLVRFRASNRLQCLIFPLGQLDLVDEVLTAKIEALQG
jgi:type I site-specific restriction endonuclease